MEKDEWMRKKKGRESRDPMQRKRKAYRRLKKGQLRGKQCGFRRGKEYMRQMSRHILGEGKIHEEHV